MTGNQLTLCTHLATFWAIENSFSMLRSTYEGLSAAVDYQGRVLAAMDYFTTEDKVMIADVSTEGRRTIYSRIGDFIPLSEIPLYLAPQSQSQSLEDSYPR